MAIVRYIIIEIFKITRRLVFFFFIYLLALTIYFYNIQKKKKTMITSGYSNHMTIHKIRFMTIIIIQYTENRFSSSARRTTPVVTCSDRI